MVPVKLSATALLVLIGGAAVGVFVWRKGGLGNALGSVAIGGLDSVSAAVGIPGPSDTTTDPLVARWIIDNFGYFTASKWCGVPALASAAMMASGTGTAPGAGTAAGRELLPLVAAAAEVDRLARRYPAPATNSPETLFGGYDPMGNQTGF